MGAGYGVDAQCIENGAKGFLLSGGSCMKKYCLIEKVIYLFMDVPMVPIRNDHRHLALAPITARQQQHRCALIIAYRRNGNSNFILVGMLR